jgi:subtilisin family serine protease
MTAIERTLCFALASAACGCGPGLPPDVAPFTSDPGSSRQGYMLDLGVPEAWSLGEAGVLVAVIDNGIDIDHPDLSSRIWTNPAEVPNGMDDDGDGHADDLHGWNFLDDSADVTVSGETSDNRNHGTSAAGIIAAETGNGVGVASCCPGCRVLPIKARDFDEEGTVIPRLAAAIEYAMIHGARVISISDGVLPEDMDAAVEEEARQAISSAAEVGILVVASAGNDGREVVRFPALVPGVLAVGAVDWHGQPTSWTSHGPEVDVAAPGDFVWTTFPDGDYDHFAGTSAAAPIAAGLAALVMAARPEWTPGEVAAYLRDTGRGAEGGAPIVDFAAAAAGLF